MGLTVVLLDMGDTFIRYRRGEGKKYKSDSTVEAAFEQICRHDPQLKNVLNRTLELQGQRYEQALVTLEEANWQDSLAEAVLERGELLTTQEQEFILAEIMDYVGNRMELYQDAVATLQALRSLNLRLGIVSNVSFAGKYFEPILARLGIAGYFDTFVWSHDLGTRKPHPNMFYTALEALNVQPNDAIHVGDTLFQDVLGAHHAGLRAVWIDRGDTRTLQYPPEWTIKELFELIPIVKTLI